MRSPVPDQHRCAGTSPPVPPLLGPDHPDRTIGERFLTVAADHEACLAVADGDLRLTYRELERWARAIAAAVAGAAPERPRGGDRSERPPGSDRVVLLLDQGAPSVAATLGVLLAGAAYVPLDRHEPDRRLRALLARIRPDAILADPTETERARDLADGRPVLVVEGPGGPPVGPGGPFRSGPLPAVDPAAIAAIHFTSGTTGAPKGVMDLHRNLVHNAMRYTVALGIEPGDRLSLVQAPSSSATMSSLFSALLNGAAVLPYRLDAGSLGSLAAWMRRERITVYHSVPAILRAALAADPGPLPDVRVVRLEGDRSYGQDLAIWRRHLRPGTRIANGLGLTETGLCRELIVPVEHEAPDGILPVGDPVPGVEVTIVGEDGGPLPAGEPGEIAVSSAHLAAGYLDDPALTDAAFTPVASRPGWRTYRTGDLGRLRPDGCLEYLGRRDGGVKVRGHRAEPAEVEAALATIPGVAAVAVRIVEDVPGSGRIVAFVVTDGVADGVADEAALRTAAAARLPAHLRPARYIRLDALPVSPAGKVDRAALHEPALPEPAFAGPAVVTRGPGPRDPLVGPIAEILGRSVGRPIGQDDDYFLAGGDSLGAVDVLLGLERLVGRRLEPSLLLRAPTAARLAAELGTDQADGAWIYPMNAGGSGAPLVLLPSHHGHHLAYAALARHLSGVRQVYASEAAPASIAGPGRESFEALARRHADGLLATPSAEAWVLGGFCFGGALAYAVARRLIEAGRPPAGLHLLGVSPYDLPDLAAPGSLEAWIRSRGRVGTLRRSLAVAAGMRSATGRAYVADRVRRRAGMLLDAASREGGRRSRERGRRNAVASRFEGHDRGPALDLPVTVVLPAWSVAPYWDDPVSLWAGIGSRIRVVVVPGVERMLLAEPVVASVARALATDPGAGPDLLDPATDA